ncbi:MAG: diaminopimelate decarboxylase, partial [Methylophilaceae bacterium]|nr:diaminopimelate decarboxylase [Methylophilaceae bacterium]
PSLQHYAQAILPLLQARHLKLVLEPGRVLVGQAGVLLTRVEYLKPSISKRFAVVDAAMNDLLRPALYAAYHRIEPVLAREGASHCYDIVGPVCESGDFLGQQRDLCLEEGDLLAILSAGAYGMSMASNYNTRPRAAEVVVDGRQIHLVRARETVADLLRLETLLPDGV